MRDQSWIDTLFPRNAERTLPWPDLPDAVTLYRPVGLRELELIQDTGYQAYPPRLPDQPIFYPVLNFEYAEEIARDWNTKMNSHCGFVTAFEVPGAFITRYEIQIVGDRYHQELWIPAEELDEVNGQILGQIRVLSAYYGEGFEGKLDPQTGYPVGITF
ncbi:hypothetical protein [Deinococcus roseus]|uniref:ADP-ribosylation/crystallin J1 n=1 Tax=Deinococcus roseus TaxID=392414 RepID=A0ABQ2D3N3_9DEIO|nr:hypothetical protein [Deinococcus roseus]GGJ44962.1 hypothetical protein GCM10008938_33990 [Deinococcus roseus]